MKPSDLKRFTLLAELSDDDRDALVELLEIVELKAGKSAFREGAEADGLVLLAEGTMNLKSKRYGGFVGTLTAPYHLGATSLFAMGQREVTALADGPCTIWRLSRTGLSRLAEDAPRAAFRLAEAAVVELAGLTRQGIDDLVASDSA